MKSTGADTPKLCTVCQKRTATCAHVASARDGKLSDSFPCCPHCHDSIKQAYGCRCDDCKLQGKDFRYETPEARAALRVVDFPPRMTVLDESLCRGCSAAPATHESVRNVPGNVGGIPVCKACHDNTAKHFGCYCAECLKPITGAEFVDAIHQTIPDAFSDLDDVLVDVSADDSKQTKEAPMGARKIAKKTSHRSNGVRDAAATMTQTYLDPVAPIERARYKEKLPCAINEAIAHEAGDELAKVIHERAIFLERRKAENTKSRERRSYYDETIEELGAKISSRTAVQDVEVVEYLFPDEKGPDHPRGIIKIIRTDTAESIGNRPAEEADLQEALLLDGAGKPVAKPPPFGEPTATVSGGGKSVTFDAAAGKRLKRDTEPAPELESDGLGLGL